MECIVLSPLAARRTALQWQLEDLGDDWRCVPVRQAAQALMILEERWVDLVILTPDGQSEALLSTLRATPLLSPPRVMGVDFAAPDGPLPPVGDLPQLLRVCHREGRLPNLTAPMLPPITQLARGMLQAVGIPQHLGAWDFLPDMAALTVVHPPLLQDLQHGLYPLIAGRHGLSPAAVERRLRLCVESTWSHGSLTALERFFGSSVDPERGKPTNREFLCRMQERLTLAAKRLRKCSR